MLNCHSLPQELASVESYNMKQLPQPEKQCKYQFYITWWIEVLRYRSR